MVRAANTGVTCFLSQFGRIADYLRDDIGETFGEGMLTGEVAVPQDRQLTFYTRHGEWLAEISAAITVAAIVFFVLRRKVAR